MTSLLPHLGIKFTADFFNGAFGLVIVEYYIASFYEFDEVIHIAGVI